MTTYNRKITSLYKLAFAVLAFGATAIAQEKENLGTEVVNIVQSYKPTLTKSNKIRPNTNLKDFQNTDRKALNYNIYSVPVASTFMPDKGSVSNLKRAQRPDLYDAYARLGFGNYTNAMAELFTNFDVGLDNLAMLLKHNSSQGGIKGAKIDDKFMRTSLDAEYSINRDRASYVFGGNLNHQMYNWYGMYAPHIVDWDPADLTKGNKQTYTSLGLDASIAMKDSFFKQADLAFRVLTDKHSSKEIWLQAKPEFEVTLGDFDLLIETDLAYLDGSFKKQYQSTFKGNKHSLFHAGVSPSFLFIDQDLSFRVGAKAYYLNDSEASESKMYVFPNMHLSYRLVDDFMTIFAKANGGIKHNSFYDLKEENPFVSPTLLIKPTRENYSLNAGLQGKLTHSIAYNVQANYKIEDDKALFVLNRPSYNEFYSKGYEKAHSFWVVYDRLKSYGFSGELVANVFESLDLGVYGAATKYRLKHEAKAWNLPNLEGKFFANYVVNDKLTTYASVVFEGKRFDRLVHSVLNWGGYSTQKLKSYADVNLQVDYQLTPQLSFFVQGNNLLGNKNKRWYAYPTQDIQVMLGAMYQFDW